MSEIVATQATIAPAPRERRARDRIALRPPGIAGITILLLFLACAIAPGWIAPYNPLAFDYRALLKPPSLTHPFGTDNFGRDLLSRVIWASRIDLQIAIFATAFPMLFGTFAGCLVGYVGGVFDSIFRRIVDVISTIPFLVLVIAIVAVLGPGLINMYVAISAAGWVVYARLVRAQMRAQRQLDYVAAGKVMGYSAPRIIFRHVLPNVAPTVVVYWICDMAMAILLGSSLGYLGLGAQPPAAEWGTLIADGKNFLTTAWWMSILPGFAIVLVGIGFSLAGNAATDLLRRRA